MSSGNDIRKQFQDKFRGHKAKVPSDGWIRLEEALNESPAVIVPRKRWYYVVSAVAAVALLIVGSILFVQRPQGTGDPVFTTTDAPKPEVSQVLEHVDDIVIAEHDVRQGVSVATKATKIAHSDNMMTKEDMQPEEVFPKQISEKHTNNVDDISESKSDAKDIEVASIEKYELTPVIDEVMDNRKPVLLAFSGRGGLNSYRQVVNAPMSLRSASVEPEFPEDVNKSVLQTQSSADNVSDMEHDQPISFGLIVSKEIIDGLYVETGLVYSFLSSKLRSANLDAKVQETQELHYLGIPININYNILQLGKLDVYASVGGMIEKDVYGERKLVREEGLKPLEDSKAEERHVTSIRQSKPQISVNAGVGASYPVYNDLRIYGKIGGSYYFDAENKWKTIYSDRKIVMDLNVGLRYEF